MHDLPPDPFADDPSDPAAALDDVEMSEPLDAEERRAIEQDLEDLTVFESLLSPAGIRGIVVRCLDCDEDHFHDWDLLRAHMLQLLFDGSAPPHEPPAEPVVEAYVTWDYCRGYADASLSDPRRGGLRRWTN